jgi:hypothetical protein
MYRPPLASSTGRSSESTVNLTYSPSTLCNNFTYVRKSHDNAILGSEAAAKDGNWFLRGHEVPEGTNKIDKNTNTIRRGHRVFYWNPYPKGHIIGLGRITETPYVESGRLETHVRILTDVLEMPLTIDQLRKVQTLLDCSFLKRGAGGTFFSLSYDQAVIVYQLCILGSPKYKGTWEDMPQTSSLARKLWDRISLQ